VNVLVVQQLAWGTRIGHEIARVLHERGHTLAAVVHGRETRRFVQNQADVPYVRIWFADPLYDRGHDPVSAEEIRDIEARCSIDSIWRVVAADRVLSYTFRSSRQFSYRKPKANDYVLSVCAATYRCARDVLDTVRPDYVIAPVIASLMNYFLYLESRRQGIPFLTVGYSRFGRLFFIADDERVTSAAIRLTHAKLADNPELSDHYERARDIYAQLRAGAVRPYQPAELRPTRYRDALSATALLPARLLRAALVSRRVTDIHNIWLPNNSRANAVVSVLVGYRELFRTTDAQGPCHRRLDDLKFEYVFYPLQVEPELALMVPIPEFANQLDLCRRIAMSLPAGVRLLVKEHPSMVSSRRPSYYDKLRGLGNVEIVHSSVPSYAVYTDRRCRAVLVLTSTVGFEAAMNGRPVVLLAPTEYEPLPTVRRAQTIEQACTELARLCRYDQPPVDADVDRGNVAFLCSLLEHSFEADYPEIWNEGTKGLRATDVVALIEQRIGSRS
jgi:hypothetical protein